MRQIAAFLLLCLAAILCAPAILAQEVLPETPPELEGFRLDTPSPQPAETPPPTPAPTTAQPETGPKNSSPPSETAPAVPANSAPPARSPPLRATPGRPSAETDRPVPAAENTEPPTRDDLPDETAVSDLPTETAPPEAQSGLNDPADNAGEASPQTANGDQASWIVWFAVAFIVGLLALGLYLFSLRRQEPLAAMAEIDPDQIPAAPIAADEIEDDSHIELVEPASMPETEEVAAAAPKQKPRARPELDMRFIPEQAVLGMVNLTIKGELKIVNHGKAMARNVRLRTAAICACANQPAMIAAFNRGELGPEADAIDNIRKGERLSVAIEVSLPRAELESYNYEGRLICVPIILAEIAYSGMRADSGQHVQIASMVGREANPPTDKMGPLRIDLGPRSFDALGQRPVTV